MIARLAEAMYGNPYGHFETLKQKCFDMESKLGVEGVSSEEFFEACFEFLCLCACLGYTDLYCLNREVCWAGRRVIMFAGMVNCRAFLAKINFEISQIASKRERWRWMNVIQEATSFVSIPWWKWDY